MVSAGETSIPLRTALAVIWILGRIISYGQSRANPCALSGYPRMVGEKSRFRSKSPRRYNQFAMSVCFTRWSIRAECDHSTPLVSILLLLSLLCGCDLPSDHALITRFNQKRSELERIRQMIDEDNLEGRVHADYADPKLSSSRLEEYRSLLRDAGVVRLWAHGKSKPFELIVDGTRFLAEGDYKGYLYDPAPKNPSLKSLDDSCFQAEQVPDSQRFCSSIRGLGNGWWLIRYEYR